MLWNAIYWILYCVKQICVDHNVEVWCEYSIAEIFWANSGGWPMVVPLWFVRDLMVVIALAFVIYWLIKKTGIISIICLSILHIMNIWIPIPGFSSESALFFSAGCYVQINGIEPLSINKKVFTVAGVTYFTMVLLTVLNWNITPINGYLHSILAISGTVFVLKLSTYIETEKTNFYNTFAGATFFIFAVHEIYVLRICDSVLAFFFSNGSELDKICIYFGGAVLTFFICAGLFFILRKFTPRLCGVLVGKRI